MGTINSKNELCNLAISRLGNYGTINDIDQPVTDKEITFALWYDVSRQTFLKLTMPNFALARRRVALVVGVVPAFGFKNVYERPSDCLKLLGIGEIDEKRNNYVMEGEYIYTDEYYTDGLPLRFVRDITDVTKMSPEFKVEFSWYLAGDVAMPITQDVNKVKLIEELLPSKISIMSGINAQENMPIRISRSRFRESRNYYDPVNSVKR